MAPSSHQRLFRNPVAIFELSLSELVRNFIAKSRTPDPDANQILYSQAIDAALGE